MLIEIEGIVLRSISYKEKDAMIEVFTPNGRISFLARGIQAINSKNASSCLIYSYSNFQINTRNGKMSLQTGTQLHSVTSMYESLEIMSALGLISEITLKMTDEEDGSLFIYFNKILELLNEGFDPLTLVILYFAKIIDKSGYQLNTRSCIICGAKQNIVTFSYTKGGFICQKCFDQYEDKIRGKEYLKTIKYIFQVEEDMFNRHIIKKELGLIILNELNDYLLNNFDLKKLNGFELFMTNYK